MNKNYVWVIIVVLISIPFAYAIHLYPYLPISIPTHFDASGEPDDYGSRSSIYLGPCIMGGVSLLLFLLLTNLKKIDPKRYQKSDDGVFWNFALFMVLFLSCLSLCILYVTSHPGVSIGKFLLPVIGLAFTGIGIFIPRIHQNYFAGIRLPWTLDNEDNWNATHKIAGKVWIPGGLIMAVSGLVFENSFAIWIFFSILVVIISIPIIFSYRMFKNDNQVP